MTSGATRSTHSSSTSRFRPRTMRRGGAEPSAATSSTSSFRRSGRRLSPCQQLQRLLMRSRTGVGIRYRRRHARHSPCRASSSIRCIRFLQAREGHDVRDTIVTLLSTIRVPMRGRPIMVAAMCADILARTLERCAVKTEILRLHDARLEGRSVTRKVDRRTASRRTPSAFNDLRHISTRTPTNPGDAQRRTSA